MIIISFISSILFLSPPIPYNIDMKLLFFALFTAISTASFGNENHFMMISDSRGNCAFGNQLYNNLLDIPKSSIHFKSTGGLRPKNWAMPTWATPSAMGLEITNSSTEENQEQLKLSTWNKKLIVGKTRASKIKSEYIADFIQRSKKQFPAKNYYTMINLGTNSFSSRDTYTYGKVLIKEIVENGSKCIWITPPSCLHSTICSQKRQNLLFNAITKAANEVAAETKKERCLIIDSRSLSTFPTAKRYADRIHYCFGENRINAGRNWANGIFSALSIYMDTEDK